MALPGFLGGIFGGKKDSPSVIGIDIGSSAIKVVQIRKKNGQAVLETYGELALGPYGGASIGQAVQLPTDKIASALADLMKEKEVNVTTKLAGIAIPFASSLMSVIEMPDVGPKQLETMVPLEARKYIPVPINEVMLDWSAIPKPEVDDTVFPTEPAGAQKKIDVLVVAIHNDTIGRYQDIALKSGVEAGFFEIEIFSTMRSVLEEGLAPVMIMDMGAASTKLYIVERGVVRASHTVNRGAQDITSAISKSLGLPVERAEVMKREMGLSGGDKSVADVINLVLEYIFAEANRTILGFEKKYNKSVSKVVLVGGGASLKGLQELAKAAFKTEAVAGNPFGKLATPAFIENILRQTGPEFAVAIGTALRKLQDEG
ncbi:type IV pilus assembly protein PilM [Candidatus Parcubacteria bacterium]|nr:type IV pilus assembly protein PilM [Candidatus Parcubacteria bacterium]